MNSAATARSTRLDQLFARLQAARTRSEELFQIVRPAALYDRPVPERHRIIFYLGHLEAFDWNLLREPLGLSSFEREFDQLFAFGIDPVEGGLPTDQPKDWPAVDRIRDYNKRLREKLDAAIRGGGTMDASFLRLEDGRLLEVAIEHRLMHTETLCYMLHQLRVDRKFSQPLATPLPDTARGSHRVEIPTGTATLGLRRSEDGPFGWDNEFEEHRVEVPAFTIDAYNVTNGDYLQFVQQGGYEQRGLWTRFRLGMDHCSEPSLSLVLDSHRKFLALPLYVLGNSPAARLACVRQPRRGLGLCTLGGKRIAERSGMASSRAWHSQRRRARVSLGRGRRHPRGAAILISSGGTRFPRDRTLKATAISVSPISWATAGNGRARRLRHSLDFSRFHSIPGIPQISLMASIS